MSKGVTWVVIGLLAIVGWAQGCRVRSLQRHLLQTQFRADSLAAAADTQITVVRGQLAVTQRQVVQTRLQRDSLDRLLKVTRPTTRLTTTIVLPRVDTVLLGQSTDTAGREATFAHYQPPYSILARVALPLPPTPPQMALAIRLDTIPLGVRVGCRPGKGLQSAYAAISSPIWAQVNLVALAQDPGVCNPPKPSYGFRLPVVGVRLPWWVPVAVGAIGWEVLR